MTRTGPPLFIGYFPKRSVPPPPWMTALGIREVASVSECISPGPDDWVQAWKHNAWGLFDTPELAWSVVRRKDVPGFRLFAYVLHPFEGEPVDCPPEDDAPRLSESFRSLGYDVVSRSTGTFFECSPLSCNHLAQDIRTNESCLLPDLDQAAELALGAESLRCEPGPYYVLEVFREA